MIARKKPPYATTKVPAEQSRMEIDRLLRSYGVQDFQWTESYSKGLVKLKFALEAAPGKFIGIEVMPPPFTAKRRTWDPTKGYVTVEAANWPQAMRCLLHWLKAKLEAVAYGLKSVEDEFLADTVVHLPDGRETTVGRLVVPAIQGGVLDLPALGAARRDPARTIDTEGG